ncbi:hypothetical protein C5167_012635 [Papaver somniferum]|uniref:Uncharacterized protein n=1 Tax=Papaver somniferum TaxID=3469 RepID=A0A4Y7J181_PAPSO|nr:uncharacterized protein LOC113355799 [Papaver somniferum]RZC53792.1 hypothetical protein C5167_012635 [Papaver somniferum]
MGRTASKRRARDIDDVENLNKAFEQVFTLDDNGSEGKISGRNNGVGIIGKEQTSSVCSRIDVSSRSERTSSTTKKRRNRRRKKLRERIMEQQVPSKNQQLTSHIIFLRRKLGLASIAPPPSKKLDINKQASFVKIFHNKLESIDSSSTGADVMRRLGLPLPATKQDSKTSVSCRGEAEKYKEILAIEALNWLAAQPLQKKQRSLLIPGSEQSTAKLTSTLDTEFSRLHV